LKESGVFLRREFSLWKSAAFFYFGGRLCEIKMLCGAREKDAKTNTLEMEVCWQEYDLWCNTQSGKYR